ncbi:hypothetical protein CBR_g6536 [Chara braunii]|uniref:Uncharacterized protein n=1 Tax=Chara braunii TaxID=69332 RepID=A0A388KK89_CHABU|nr:hypothetical protein CBR_g6536 [Chara braunii]|eukprot:GBG70408.1 hypothetical protein CBR_g6536 [Chara braunii]
MAVLDLGGAFTPVESLIGGILLGICVYYLAAYNGKVTGISGIVSSFINLDEDYVWRGIFLIGMIGTGAVAFWTGLVQFENFKDGEKWGHYALAGVLVGFGTKMGMGCTSGHMLCGLSRLSVRSLVATMSFFSTAVLVASYFERGNDLPTSVRIPSATEALPLFAVPVAFIVAFETLRLLHSRNALPAHLAFLVTALLGGIAFSLGLILSGMVLQSKVLGFLDPFKHWDPSLLMVVVGGLLPNVVLYRATICKMTAPLFANKFAIPRKTEIEWKLMAGGVLFGLGWGYLGLCPGPALVNLPRFTPPVLFFAGAMIVGMRLFVGYSWLVKKLKRE